MLDDAHHMPVQLHRGQGRQPDVKMARIYAVGPPHPRVPNRGLKILFRSTLGSICACQRPGQFGRAAQGSAVQPHYGLGGPAASPSLPLSAWLTLSFVRSVAPSQLPMVCLPTTHASVSFSTSPHTPTSMSLRDVCYGFSHAAPPHRIRPHRVSSNHQLV